MGYVVTKYVICDACGVFHKNVFKSKVPGKEYHQMWAERRGWEITKDGWFCPKCRRIHENAKDS